MEPLTRAEIPGRAAAGRDRASALNDRTSKQLAAALEQVSKQAEELRELRAKVTNLETALETNRRIGQAIGIIMASRLITADAAFEILRNASQRSHRKLREVADVVVATGEVPTAASDPS